MSEQKNKWDLFKAFLKAYWWAILIILITPVLLNFIILLPVFLTIIGGSSEWLSFQGSYICYLISNILKIFFL